MDCSVLPLYAVIESIIMELKDIVHLPAGRFLPSFPLVWASVKIFKWANKIATKARNEIRQQNILGHYAMDELICPAPMLLLSPFSQPPNSLRVLQKRF